MALPVFFSIFVKNGPADPPPKAKPDFSSFANKSLDKHVADFVCLIFWLLVGDFQGFRGFPKTRQRHPD